jgi:hypothetical protein
MKIAVLGWGSLIWNLDELRIIGRFQPGGPILPIEFCRVSQDGRLTLVVDQTHGAPCVTYHAESTFTDLSRAVENLQHREKMLTVRSVGWVNRVTLKVNSEIEVKQPATTRTILKWAEKKYDAVIWTALGMKFKEATGIKFSVDAAVRYLEGLNPEMRSLALDYIRRAPAEVKTPVRVAVNDRWPTVPVA